ncbi:MAG: helix-hairpin-helix domain-containing protein [Chitinophagaceae bacterium]
MDNYTIADNFSLLSKLMDIHGENSFKAKSYAIAAFAIEKLPEQLINLPQEKIFSIKGIGDATGKKITEQLQTGRLSLLDKYLEQTPQGIIEMLQIKGLGPKKIATIWKELEVESIGELLYACNENRLLLYKGFGEKTQTNIRNAIEFYMANQGSHLYADIELYANNMHEKLKIFFKQHIFLPTGDFRKQVEVIDKLEWVTTASAEQLKNFFEENDIKKISIANNFSQFKTEENVLLYFHHTTPEKLYLQQFVTSSSEEFLNEWGKKYPLNHSNKYSSEEDIFIEAGTDFIPSFLREKQNIIEVAAEHKLPDVITVKDISAIIHSHSKWSDGVNSIDELATAAMKKGFQFLVISDHSKSAFYANGLTVERIRAQHEEINELNKKVFPFKIFKSIESDILNDGSLDYANEILQTFDLVITSVHSNLKMNEEKAMKRLLKAIENPFTNILGHMTGRLLLSRNGYPINHKKIIEACAANNVVIELNAHPRRLDMDWRWIDYAVEKNVLISIDPDAHSVYGFDDIKFGVLAAQKAGLTKEQNLSSFSLQAFENFITVQQLKRNFV